METPLAKLIDLLESERNGSLPKESSRPLLYWKDFSDMPHGATILANLEHYWDDADIRSRDPDYGRMQNSELEKLIQKLRQADFDGAARITFLTSS